MQISRMGREDFNTISNWDQYYDSDYQWEYCEILHYLEADNMQDYLIRIIKAQKEDFAPDKRFAYVLKEKKEILAFTFFALNECKNKKWDLFIQSIVVNPEHRGEGYGKILLSHIFANPTLFIGYVPDNVVALVSPTNRASLKLFDSFTTFEKQWFKAKFYFIEAKYINVYKAAKKCLDGSVLWERYG